MRKPFPLAPPRLLQSFLFVAAIGAAASAQSVPPFAGPFIYDGGPSVFGFQIKVADLDDDSRADLLIRPTFPAAIRYRLANQNGSFAPVFEIPLPFSADLVPADAGDGTPELFTFSGLPCPGPSILGFLNSGRTCAQGAGLQMSPFGISIPCSGTSLVQSAVFAGATIVAAVAPTIGSFPTIETFTFHEPASPGAQPTVTASGAPYTPAFAPNTFPQSVAVMPCGDLDGDGSPDVIVRSAIPLTSFTFELLRQTPAGLVQNVPTSALTVAGITSPTLLFCDLTGEGRTEIIVGVGGVVTVYRNQGPVPGSNGGVRLTPFPFNTHGVAISTFADIDGDGDLDAAGMDQTNQVTILTNNGDGILTLAPPAFSSGSPSVVVTGDFDGDGDADLAAGGSLIRVGLNQLVPSAIARPGTADGMVVESSISPPGAPAPAPTSAPFFDFKTGAGGAIIELFLEAHGFVGDSGILASEIFPTGCAPAFPFSNVWVSGGPSTLFFASFTVPPGARHAVSIAAPPLPLGAQNLSGILQFIVFSPEAQNGVFATSEAHEFQF